jgi:RNA polymerase sigma factor (sigma-70 family)
VAQEKELIRRAQKGDTAAFGLLVQKHETKIYTLMLRMTRNPEDAKDLAQESFLLAYRKIHTFRMESSFSTWLCRLASHLCIDFLRREKRRREQMPQTSWERGMETADQRGEPQAKLEQAERKRALERGIEKLSEDHRQVLLLREIGGLSYEEIGAVLKLEPGTVKSRLARARRSLRDILREDGNFFDHLSSKQTTGKGRLV